jgi:hypothetical protein
MEHWMLHTLALESQTTVPMVAAGAVNISCYLRQILEADSCDIADAAYALPLPPSPSLSLSTLQPQLSCITTVFVTARRVWTLIVLAHPQDTTPSWSTTHWSCSY